MIQQHQANSSVLQNELWSKITHLVTDLDVNPLKRSDSIYELASLSQLYHERQAKINTVDVTRFKDNETLLKSTMRRKIVLHYSDNPAEQGEWIVDFLKINRKRISTTELTAKKFDFKKQLLVEYIFCNIQSLDVIPELFNVYGTEFSNCELYLIIDDKVQPVYSKYRSFTVKNAGDLVRKFN